MIRTVYCKMYQIAAGGVKTEAVGTAVRVYYDLQTYTLHKAYIEFKPAESTSSKKKLTETGPLMIAMQSYNFAQNEALIAKYANSGKEYYVANMLSAVTNTYITTGAQEDVDLRLKVGYPSYANIYTHLSSYPPYYIETLADIIVSPVNLSPAAFANPAKINRLSWDISTDVGEDGNERTQKSAKIQWTSDTVSIKEYSVGAEQYYDVPANTFPKNSSFKWRVKITSDDDVESDWCDWVSVSTTDVAGTVRALSPDNAIIDADVQNRISWIYNNTYGTKPTGYDIEMSSNGGLSWQQIKTLKTSDCYADIPAGTFPGGIVQYRVRAYSQSGAVSEWAVANVTVRARPNIPSIYRIDTDTDRPTIYWESVSQETYELKILDFSGTKIYSHYAALPERSHRIAKRLDNAQYTATLKIRNEYNYESPTAQRQFTLDVIKPEIPGLIGTAFLTHNQLFFSYTTARAVLIRDGIAIADVSGLNSYDDYTAPQNCEYRLRALSDSAFCDSEPVVLSYPSRRATLSLANDSNVRISLICRAGLPPERSSTLSFECTLLQFAGRKRPVAEYGEQITRNKSLSYSLRSSADLKTLKMMVNQTVIWNDRSDHMVACLSGLSWSEHRGYVDVSFTLTEIDASEEIDYE